MITGNRVASVTQEIPATEADTTSPSRHTPRTQVPDFPGVVWSGHPLAELVVASSMRLARSGTGSERMGFAVATRCCTSAAAHGWNGGDVSVRCAHVRWSQFGTALKAGCGEGRGSGEFRT